jgi:hypothetical protein
VSHDRHERRTSAPAPPEDPVASLIAVLTAASECLSQGDDGFVWSRWDDAEEARAEIRDLVRALRGRGLPDRTPYDALFAPTGPLQEVSIGGGWGDDFLALAERFDRVAARVWGGARAGVLDAGDPGFGCPSCWPDAAEAAWAVRPGLERMARPIDEAHLSATLLRCRACGQVFLSLFAERIDWAGGEDAQSWTVLPLTEEEVAGLTRDGPPGEGAIAALGVGRRSLRREHPSDGPLRVFWGRGVRVEDHD